MDSNLTHIYEQFRVSQVEMANFTSQTIGFDTITAKLAGILCQLYNWKSGDEKMCEKIDPLQFENTTARMNWIQSVLHNSKSVVTNINNDLKKCKVRKGIIKFRGP